MVRYIQECEEYINIYEVSLYIIDAVPMFVVMVVKLLIYPPKLFSQEESVRLAD